MIETEISTSRVIAEMLTENTGKHFLDSGGAYGRAWQRNQAAAGDDPVAYFNARPEAWWDYGPTLDVYHFLTNRMDYAPRLDRAFRTFVEIGPRWDDYTKDTRYSNSPGTAEEFIEQLTKKGWADPDQDFSGMSVNTYNGEDFLTQTLQYHVVYLTEDCPWADSGEDYYLLLSIHGGADVRGGYTDIRAFWLNGWDGVAYLLDNNRADLACTNDDCPGDDSEYNRTPNWTADGSASSWLYDGGTGGPDPEPQEGDEWGEHLPNCPFCHQPLTVYAPIAS